MQSGPWIETDLPSRPFKAIDLILSKLWEKCKKTFRAHGCRPPLGDPVGRHLEHPARVPRESCETPQVLPLDLPGRIPGPLVTGEQELGVYEQWSYCSGLRALECERARCPE